jgi:hypothetical protein
MHNQYSGGRARDEAANACDILRGPSPSGPDAAPPSRGLSILFQNSGAYEMTMTIRTIVVCVVSAIAVVIGTAVPADAQYGRRTSGNPAVGETYHVEGALTFWRPDPALEIASESLGIPGTTIDAVEDLGFENSTFRDFKIVLRPTRKFKFRLGYTPIKYEAESTLTRDIIFNGQLYRVGLPVNSELTWKAWRFGLEYDFVYRDRGFAGFIVEAKYTDLEVQLDSPVISEFTHVKVPIPTIGGIGRVYVADNVSITGELTGLSLNIEEDEGRYFDFDLYGTFNVNNNVGAQVGYRRVTVHYIVDSDIGDLKLGGLYFGGVARF